MAILTREKQERPRLLDVGTGSGCILLTLLAELPGATGTATDISQAALDCARENAARLGVLDRVDFRPASALEGVAGPYDMLLSNPPYIRSADIAGLSREVTQHDPLTALDGGANGLEVYRLIVRDAARVVPAGWIVLEIGHDQADQVLALARDTGTIAGPTSTTYMDLGRRQRCVAWKTHV
jgi:release factor glutamine methyltransferase